MDRGAWWATVHGVTRSWTHQKQTHRAEGRVKSEAEVGVGQLQPKGPLEPPQAGGRKKD